MKQRMLSGLINCSTCLIKTGFNTVPEAEPAKDIIITAGKKKHFR